MNEVKFTRRYTTDVQYEFEEITLTTMVGKDETETEAILRLKASIEAAHAGEVPLDDVGQDEEETQEEKPPKKTSKKSKPAPTTTPDDESEEDEDGEDESEDSADDSETVEEDEDGEQEEEKPAKGKKPAGGKKTESAGSKTSSDGKKKFKKKPQVYQRTNEAFKEIFSGILREVAPNWKKTPESKALAKKVSQKMEGADFLDDDGDVYASFKETVRKAMKGGK